MQFLKNSNLQLNTCQGCIAGITETLKEALTDKKIAQYKKAFIRTRNLKE